jgi:hypothetical protein
MMTDVKMTKITAAAMPTLSSINLYFTTKIMDNDGVKILQKGHYISRTGYSRLLAELVPSSA